MLLIFHHQGTGTQSYSAAAQCGVEFVDELANEEASETVSHESQASVNLYISRRPKLNIN